MPDGKVSGWTGHLSVTGKGIQMCRGCGILVDSLCMLAERRGRNIGSLSRHGLQFAAIAGDS